MCVCVLPAYIQTGVEYNLKLPTGVDSNKNKKQKTLFSLTKGSGKGNETLYPVAVAGLVCPQQWPSRDGMRSLPGR